MIGCRPVLHGADHGRQAGAALQFLRRNMTGFVSMLIPSNGSVSILISSAADGAFRVISHQTRRKAVDDRFDPV